MPANLGSAVGYLELDTSKFDNNLQTATNNANAKTKSMAATVGNNMTAVGTKMASVGTTMTAKVTTPIVALGTAAVKATSNFDSGMSKVSAISGATGKDLDALRAKAKEMGVKTKFSASESAEAFKYMAMAGWKTKDMLDGIDGIMALSAADGLDLATTSDIVTDGLTAFGLKAKDSSHFADVLAKTSSSANTNVSMLGESFKYVAPVAGSMGYSVEDVSVALGTMANSGIKASQAGTSLRTLLTNMANPTDKMAQAMDDLGVSLDDGHGNMKSLKEIMGDLRSGFGGLKISQSEYDAKLKELNDDYSSGAMSESTYNKSLYQLTKRAYGAEGAMKAQSAAMLAGKTGMAGLLAIVNASDEDFAKLTEEIENADGSAQNMADTMLDNLGGQLTLLKSALEGLAISFGELLMPALINIVKRLQGVVTWLANLDEGQKKTIMRIAGIVAAVGPLLLVGGKIISGVGKMITAGTKIAGFASQAVTSIKHVGEAFKLAKAGYMGFAGETSKLGALLGGLTGPVIAVVAVIAVLVAAFVTLWKTNDGFRKKITEIWNSIVGKFKEAGQKITDALNSLGFNFKDIVDVLKAAWIGFCNLLAPLFEGVFTYISKIIGGVVDIFTGVFEIVTGIIKGFKDGDWSLFVNGLKDVFNGFIGLITAPFQGLFAGFEGILESFGTTWQNVWGGVADFFKGIWSGITGFFSGLWDGIKTIVSTAWEGIKTIVSLAFQAIRNVIVGAVQIITLPFRFIWENCKDIITSVWEKIKNVVSTAFTFIRDKIITPVGNTIKTVTSKVWGGIKTVTTTVWNAIKTAISTVVNAIKSVVSTAWNGIKSVVSTVMNGIKSVVSTIWNGIKSKIGGIIGGIKSVVSSGFGAVKNTVSNVLGGVKNLFTNVFGNIKKVVGGAVKWLKGVFKFKWELPKIKLPHFDIKGKFSLNPPSVPKLDIKWYKKAMNNGMILNSPTIFGLDKSGSLLAGGEAGSETVVGTQNLMAMISQVVSETMAQYSSALSGATSVAGDGDIVIPVYIGNELIDTMVVNAIKRNNYRSGGR